MGKAKGTGESVGLMQSIDQATESDLQLVTGEIDKLSVEIDKLQKKRAFLLAVQKLLGKRFSPPADENGQASERKPRQATGNRLSDSPQRAYEWVAKQGRPCSGAEIGRACQIPNGSMTAVLRNSGLAKNDAGLWESGKS